MDINRQKVFHLLGLGVFFWLGGIVVAEAAETPHWNVLILFTDDQRADTIAALGNPVIKTPNLDRLVRAGLAFDCAYMQGGMHGATCIPSRAMLLT
ncbi:MAG TPA: sulfatase-like hydrolase/transferase, partial [Thermoguttaceae bacterium]|nr:sulfatase-like hydrolase/transferase [Thermoguttaceae bacterium]